MSSSNTTRVIRLGPHAARDPSSDTMTRVTAEHPRIPPAASPAELFARDHREMARVWEGFSRPGVVAFAASSEGGLQGHLWLEASDTLRAGTVGRHSHADLHLPGDEALSLRHLLIWTRRDTQGVRLRVTDLRTITRFRDETGRALDAVEANGPLVLQVASWWLFLFPTGGELPWDVNAADPWTTLPERRSAELEVSGTRGEAMRPRSPRSRRPITQVTPVRAVVDTSVDALVDSGEHVEAHLIVERTDQGGEHRIPVGASALDRGVLLGRYSRCDGSALFSDDRVSRVHALLLRDRGDTFVVDVGTTNGTAMIDELFRQRELTPHTRFDLGGAVRLRWEPVN